MGRTSVSIQIKNLRQLLKQAEEIRGASEKIIKNTVKDVKARAPGWISNEVRQEYNIKKSEVMPAKDRATGRRAASVGVTGDTIETMAIVYKGERLTPLHFSMTPKKPAGLVDKPQAIPGAGIKTKGGAALDVAMARPRKKYTVQATIKKGQKKKLRGKYNTPIFIAPAAKGSTTMIPFQRSPGGKYKVEAIHTLSVPQMVDNEKVNAKIYEKINEEAAKRLQHHIDRILGS